MLLAAKKMFLLVTHCATRMRFVLNDESKADVKTIEAIPAVKGTFTNAGQFQIIIGNDVPLFYNDFTAVLQVLKGSLWKPLSQLLKAIRIPFSV